MCVTEDPARRARPTAAWAGIAPTGVKAVDFVRRNVWELGDDWAEPVLWYARGVAAMKRRELAEPTSWRFYAAMHGFNTARWQQLGALDATDEPPATDLIRQFWRQCQHGSWYFLPWHRGYVQAFEANIRAEVEQLGGPADWALPYWNYFKPEQDALPAAFASPDWPDGTGDNPLFVVQRYGPLNDGNVFVPVSLVNLQAMADPDFTGVSSGGSPGFGGVDTGFSHAGQVHGGIETQPHDWVHGLVGGADPDDQSLTGAMSDPRTAGLDPIFWLHHANIDRLWEAWNRGKPPRANPSEAAWLGGPAGGRGAQVLRADAGRQHVGVHARGGHRPRGPRIRYDDLEPGAPPPRTMAERRVRLGMGPAAREDRDVQEDVELMGSNDHPMPLRGEEASTRVRMDPQMRSRVARSLVPGPEAAAGGTSPDRVFLNLENVRGQSDAAAFQVYVGVPSEDDPASHPERLAGSVAPFGVTQASDPDDEHAGQGLTFVLEITGIVDDMHHGGLVRRRRAARSTRAPAPGQVEDELNIGRISIFRQGR